MIGGRQQPYRLSAAIQFKSMDHAVALAQVAGDLLLRQVHHLQQVRGSGRDAGLVGRVDRQLRLMDADLKGTGSSGCAPPAAG